MTGRQRMIVSWLTAAAAAAATAAWTLDRAVSTFGEQVGMWTGADFANNTWRAVRGLVHGRDVYAAAAVIPGIGHVHPVAEHMPATLLWEAPFAALPLRPAFFVFTAASLAAIWAAVYVLTRPRNPAAVVLTAACATFAVSAGAGQWTLLLGQPTGFALAGVAVVLRGRRPWTRAAGLTLAASTIQTGVPLALALIVLGAWPVVWRAAAALAALSVPPVAAGVAAAGVVPFLRTFTAGAGAFAGRTSNRIDLGALLHRAGVTSTAVQVAAGIAVLVLALLFLARLPARLRRIDNPPVLCLALAVTLLCAYHQPYDLLLFAGAVVPATLMLADRSPLTLAVFGLAGVAAGVPQGILDPVCVAGVAVLSAVAARRATVTGDAAPQPQSACVRGSCRYEHVPQLPPAGHG